MAQRQKQQVTAEEDVIDVLLRQHEEIRSLFSQVEAAPAADRQEIFDRLRRLLAVHETAEQQIVHPAARRAVHDGQSGDQVVDARLKEEHDATEKLADLEKMDVTTPEFLVKLGELRAAVLDHAENEEREEFPKMREHIDDKTRQQMATALLNAEKLAPTHPHPGAETPGKQLLVGPFASMLDRVRDALKQHKKD